MTNNNYLVLLQHYYLTMVTCTLHNCICFTYRFSMQHDGVLNDCPSDSDLIMDAFLGGGSGLFRWSRCSAEFLKAFLK